MIDEKMAEKYKDEYGFGSDCNNLTSYDANQAIEQSFIAGYKAGMKDVKAQWKKYYMICSSPCCGIDGVKVTGRLDQCVKTEEKKYEN